jgi:hypothetical protein
LVDLGTSKRNGQSDLVHSISLDSNSATPPTAKKYSRLLRLINVAKVDIQLGRISQIDVRCLLPRSWEPRPESAARDLAHVVPEPILGTPSLMEPSGPD